MNGKDGFVICHIWGINNTQSASCQALNFYSNIRNIGAVNIIPGTWHKLRIEIYPGVPTFEFYIDDAYIGNFTPPQPDSYKFVQYTFNLLSGCDGDACIDHSQRKVEGFSDYAKIGKIP